jgi:energy-coupling factor transport system permease protein
MLRDLSLGAYFPAESILHRLQARTKLLVLFWIFVTLVVANHRPPSLVPQSAITALVLLGAALSGIPVRQLWRRTRILSVVLIGAAILLLLDHDGTPIVNSGPIVITDDGVWLFVVAGIMLIVLYLAALLLTLTTTPVALGEGLTSLLAPLRRFNLPVDDFALMTLIAVRFIPTLIGDVEGLVEAQQSRGADLRRGNIRDRTRSLTALFVPLVHGVLRRASELALALEARGHGADTETTMLHETSFGREDVAALALTVVVTALAFLV